MTDYVGPGVCRHCRCTEADVDGDKRSWVDSTRTCCNSYGCVKAERARKDAALAASSAERRARKLNSEQVNRAIRGLKPRKEARQ